MTRFVVVPQWQGSPSARAMLLVDGAEAIGGDLPRARTVHVDVPASAGESLGTGIRRFSALARVRDDLGAALVAETPEEHTLVIGGDCGVAVPAIAHAAAAHDRLAVVWFDAHADLHSPATSPSGAYGGMALRAVIDPLPLSPARGNTTGADDTAVADTTAGAGTVPPDRVFLVGAREVDEAEQALLAARPLALLDAGALDDPAALVSALVATGATAVHIHVDLDVLDPAVIDGLAAPVPFGLSVEALVGAIRAVRGALPLAGASLSGFTPSSPDAAVGDLGTILRIVGALA